MSKNLKNTGIYCVIITGEVRHFVASDGRMTANSLYAAVIKKYPSLKIESAWTPQPNTAVAAGRSNMLTREEQMSFRRDFPELIVNSYNNNNTETVRAIVLEKALPAEIITPSTAKRA